MAKREKKQRKMLAPIITMAILIFIVMIGSFLLSILHVDSNTTAIVGGKLATSLVVVRNIFSKEGIAYFFSNVVTNFALLQPLILLLLSFMAISIGKTSGLFKHLFTPLKRVNPKIITFFVVFVSVISTIIGDYSYIILFPLVAIMYQYLGKSPVLGILTVFLGITLGYGTGVFYNYNDYTLGMLTQNAAIIDVDASYQYSLYSNLYIMWISTVIVSFLLTLLIEKYLSKKVVNSESYTDEIVTNRKALLASFIAFVLLVIGVSLLSLPSLGGTLLDSKQPVYIAQLLGDTAPFHLSFMFIFLIIMAIVGFIYGFISKNFKNNLEYGWGFTKQFDNLGYLFILMFLSSILIGIIDWTNLGVVITNRLVELLSLLNLAGIPLIVVAFILIIMMSIFMPNSLEKWVLISPIVIPLFMRGNMTPDFAQFVFKAADSVGKVLTPVFLFFPIMVGFIQKYNEKENKITLFGTFKLIWPTILTMIIFWLLLLILWYIAGLPLGIGTLATM